MTKSKNNLKIALVTIGMIVVPSVLIFMLLAFLSQFYDITKQPWPSFISVLIFGVVILALSVSLGYELSLKSKKPLKSYKNLNMFYRRILPIVFVVMLILLLLGQYAIMYFTKNIIDLAIFVIILALVLDKIRRYKKVRNFFS